MHYQGRALPRRNKRRVEPPAPPFSVRTLPLQSQFPQAPTSNTNGDSAVPSHGKYAAIISALAVGGFVIGISEFTIMGLMPNVAREFGIAEQTVGHLISIYALGVVVGAPTLALIAGRVSRKTMLIVLMAAYAAANLLSGLSPSYRWMMLFRFVSGLPHGAFFGLAALVAASVSRPQQRGAAVARVMLGITLALLVGNPLAVAIGQALSWRYAFYMVAGGALITIALLAWALPRDGQERPQAGALAEMRDFNRPAVWLTLCIGAVGFAGCSASLAIWRRRCSKSPGFPDIGSRSASPPSVPAR